MLEGNQYIIRHWRGMRVYIAPAIPLLRFLRCQFKSVDVYKRQGLYRTRMRDEQQWEELIPPRDNIMLEGFTLFTDWLVVEERQRGLTSLRQINRKTREVIGIAFDDPAYVTWIAYNPEPETCLLYTSRCV